MRIVILSAFTDESEKIIDSFPNPKEKIISACRCMVSQWGMHEIILSQTGIGTTASAIITTALCEKLEPDLIIFCGVAGGLKPDQQAIGDLVLANKIIDADLHQLPKILQQTPYKNALINPHTLDAIAVEYTLHNSIIDVIHSFALEGLDVGVIVTSNTFPAPKNLFSEIKSLGCSAIEMESSGLFAAAERYGVPVLTMRAISNLLNEEGEDLGTTPDALTICADRLSQGLIKILEKIIPSMESLADFNQCKKIDNLIAQHKLTKHPEGGWYSRRFRSDCLVKSEGDPSRYSGESRSAGTSIVYLLPQGDFSGWHTVKSDETWFFHAGEPLLIRIIEPISGELNDIILGGDSGYLQYTVKAGYVFSAEPLGRFSLTSCVVTPGFDFKDFELLTIESFIEKYPQHKILSRLARDRPVVPVSNSSENKLFKTVEHRNQASSSSSADMTWRFPSFRGACDEESPQ